MILIKSAGTILEFSLEKKRSQRVDLTSSLYGKMPTGFYYPS